METLPKWEKNTIALGDKFGSLEVSGPRQYVIRSRQRVSAYLCRCDCGAESVHTANSLKTGNAKSCGCARNKQFVERAIAEGTRFGRLVIIGPRVVIGEGRLRRAEYRCRCDCGSEVTVKQLGLAQGSTQSCGCLARERRLLATTTHNDSGAKHRARLYRIWSGMVQRTTNPKSQSWKHYGGRGISMCLGWRTSYEAFRDWAASNGYADNLSIDRINNDGNYEPANCRWATSAKQHQNRRISRLMEAYGETKCIDQWAHDPRCRVSNGTLWRRITKEGMSPEEALSTPKRNRNGVVMAGMT